jgi:hypothetical protein
MSNHHSDATVIQESYNENKNSKQFSFLSTINKNFNVQQYLLVDSKPVFKSHKETTTGSMKTKNL